MGVCWCCCVRCGSPPRNEPHRAQVSSGDDDSPGAHRSTGLWAESARAECEQRSTQCQGLRQDSNATSFARQCGKGYRSCSSSCDNTRMSHRAGQTDQAVGSASKIGAVGEPEFWVPGQPPILEANRELQRESVAFWRRQLLRRIAHYRQTTALAFVCSGLALVGGILDHVSEWMSGNIRFAISDLMVGVSFCLGMGIAARCRFALKAISKMQEEADSPIAEVARNSVIRLITLNEQAMRTSHPLLAAEIERAVTVAFRLMPVLDPDQANKEIATSLNLPENRVELDYRATRFMDFYRAARFERRVLRARCAYWFNLPLSSENAQNFAVSQMADRIARINDLIGSRLQSATAKEGWGGSRV
jgi:hypothetical protein